MKTSRNPLRTGSVLAVVLVSGMLAVAQSEPEGRPERRARPPEGAPRGESPRPDGQFRPQAGALGFGAALPIMRVLTEEQRESLRDIMQEQREKSRDMQEKLRELRQELLTAGLGPKFNENAIRKKAMEAAKLEAELTVMRARALSQVRPPLSPEQIEQIKNPPPLAPGQFRGEGRAAGADRRGGEPRRLRQGPPEDRPEPLPRPEPD